MRAGKDASVEGRRGGRCRRCHQASPHPQAARCHQVAGTGAQLLASTPFDTPQLLSKSVPGGESQLHDGPVVLPCILNQEEPISRLSLRKGEEEEQRSTNVS